MICKICDSEFDLETEGGAEGYFGIIPVAFCSTCFTCMADIFGEHDEEHDD